MILQSVQCVLESSCTCLHWRCCISTPQSSRLCSSLLGDFIGLAKKELRSVFHSFQEKERKTCSETCGHRRPHSRHCSASKRSIHTSEPFGIFSNMQRLSTGIKARDTHTHIVSQGTQSLAKSLATPNIEDVSGALGCFAR